MCGTIAGDERLSREGASEYVLTCSVTVASGATLTLAPGTVVKAESLAGLIVRGGLVAEGTDAAKVTMTSIDDDSVGQVSGSGAPAAGDWEGIDVEEGAWARLKDTVLEYAATALSARRDAEVSITGGAIVHSTVGVSSAEFVEAAEVEWGSASGPSPFGSGTAIEGEVLATRWVGFAAPAKPAPGSSPEQTDETTCGQVLFLGVRGSGESPQGAKPYAANEMENMGARVPAIEAGVRAKLESYASGHDTTELPVRPVAIRYPAMPIARIGSTKELNEIGRERPYLENIWTGVYSLESTIAMEEARCADGEQIVLAGYSSGALVIHLALAELEGSATISPSLIAAVVLIADPSRAPGEGVIEAGDAPASAEGLYTRIFEAHPLPALLTGRTISVCDVGDIVCATAPGSNGAVHTAYTAAELEPLGERAAEAVLSG